MPRPSPTPPPAHPGLRSEFEHPAVDLTVAQVITLLEQADRAPGGTRELLEVTRTDGTTAQLAAPEDLAGVEDLDRVQHIVQRVRFGDQGEHVTTVGAAGLQVGTVDAESSSPARSVSQSVRDVFEEQQLEPRGLPMSPMLALVMVMALCVAIGAPLMAVGTALGLPLFVRVIVLVVAIGMLPSVLLPRIMEALQRRRPHWLQREKPVKPRINAGLAITLASIAAAVVAVVVSIWVVA